MKKFFQILFTFLLVFTSGFIMSACQTTQTTSNDGNQDVIQNQELNNGSLNENSNTCTLTILSNISTYGTVTGAGSFTKGSEQRITAVANTGYYFEKWSDNNTNPDRYVTLDSNTTLTAYFKQGSRFDQFGYSVIAENANIEYTGSGYFKTLRITPQSTNNFSYWSNSSNEIYSTSSEIIFDGMHDGILEKDAYFKANNTMCGYFIGWERRASSGVSENCTYGYGEFNSALSFINWWSIAYKYDSELYNMTQIESEADDPRDYYRVDIKYVSDYDYIERRGDIFKKDGQLYINFQKISDLSPANTIKISGESEVYVYNKISPN